MRKPNGIWVSPHEFVSFAEIKASAKPVATRARVLGSFNTGGWLPNPDPVLRKMGKSIQIYRDLLADAHVGGCVRRRKASVLALDHGFDREQSSSRAFAVVEKVFSRLKLRQVISGMLDAPLYGYQPVEVMWDYVDDYLVPVQLVAKPPEWFGFDDDNHLLLKTRDAPQGEAVSENKYLLLTQDASYDNPYGVADLSRCYWPAMFKRGGLEFWLRFTERYGSPFLVGKHPRSAHNTEVDDLLTSLEAMVQDAVAAIPDDSSIEIIEAAGKGSSAEVYERLLMFCRSEISIALLGQNQTTEADANRASALAGMEVTDEIRDGDAAMVAEALNTLVRWTVELNFDADMPVWSMWAPETTDKVQAERDQMLKLSGANFTNQYFQREYSLQDGDLGEPLPPQPMGMGGYPSFGERQPPRTEAVQQGAKQLVDITTPIIDHWLDKIRQFAEEEPTLEALQDRLLAEFDHLSEEELVPAMARAFEAVNLRGRYEVISRGR
ncbi:hypothetical protein YP72344_02100 [Yersinia pseudotuberculosis]|uniref:DUF935 domain-containing protein n=1 Tax=Yersinia pseudotuberculosis complex TaxID=1649845 RepID=UPI00061BF2D7|nr:MULTISPECIES: DUF935 family protein [Yersinia pseudotuberculosis complex]BCU88715.1 hypothetical protein YP72344_02100 [Yersinia pseudotuberculosis]CNC37711.1 Mu-like prophage protein gp29 [Yersinia similis]